MSQPSEQDLIAGFDPTSYATISGAQLLELVGGANPYTDKGFIILNSDTGGVPNVPDATTTTKWQSYLWLRLSPLTTSFTLLAWNPAQTYNLGYSDGSGNTVSTNWNPVSTGSIPAGSILGYMIANATITADKIISIDISQVTGAGSLVNTATVPAAGSITGSFATGFVINNGAVTNVMLALLSVATGNIQDDAVTPAKLAPSGSVNTYMTDILGTTPAWITLPSIIKPTSTVVTTGNAGKTPRVATTGAGDTGTWEMVTSTLIGTVLQVVTIASTAAPTQPASAIANATTTPNYNGNGMVAFFDSGAFVKRDTTGVSKLLITVNAVIGCTNSTNFFVGLYNATGATAPLAGAGGNPGAAGVQFVAFEYTTAANPTNATYYVAFGSTTNSFAHGNSIAGTNLFNITQSSITIVEYIP